ncbi:MAG: peptidoglycan-binding domain-containing protein [bacterium]
MKRIIAIAFIAVLTLSLAAMGLAQQATKPMEKKQTTAPAKAEHKAMTATTEHLKLAKDEIIALQNALINAKVYKGKANGNLDMATKRALRKYQQDNKLKVTGEPNEATLIKLGVSYTHNETPGATHPTEQPADVKQRLQKRPNRPRINRLLVNPTRNRIEEAR